MSQSSSQQYVDLTVEEKEKVGEQMLQRLCTTTAHFSHQQRGTPDLTMQQKYDMAAAILEESPTRFLAR